MESSYEAFVLLEVLIFGTRRNSCKCICFKEQFRNVWLAVAAFTVTGLYYFIVLQFQCSTLKFKTV